MLYPMKLQALIGKINNSQERIMSVKLEYLRKYNKKVEIITNENIDNHLCYIPEKWRDIVKESNFFVKKNKIIKLWKEALSVELRNTIQYLSDNLESLDLLYDTSKYSLLYGIRSSENELFYYEGQFVLDLDKNIELKKRWDSLPSSIKRFYEDLHNGFYYYASHSMGLVPEDEVTYLGEYDWGIMEILRKPIKIDISSSFGFFSNGMGAYVVIDSNNCLNEDATIWFKDKQPIYQVNFWDIVDEWMVLGFQF